MTLIKALWRGEIPLYKTFWLFGFAVNFLLNITFLYFEFQPHVLSNIMGIIFFGVLVLFAVVYGPFILIATWRSANKYQGLQQYAIAAKFMVILGWGRYLQSLGEFGKAFSQ